MRVDLFINNKAGYANQTAICKKVREVLFRCSLHFHFPESIEQMRAEIAQSCEDGSEFLIVAGGDGTLNVALEPLMKRRLENLSVPKLCVLPVGTANDLASELGLSKKIQDASRAILEGDIKNVDVLEITDSNGHASFMLTNGGLGIPAKTAQKANQFRSWIKTNAENNDQTILKRALFKAAKKTVEVANSKIYETILMTDIPTWNSSDWKVEISSPGREPFITSAPFVMINNQTSVGSKFKSAPFTDNTDGQFNVMLIEPTKIIPQLKSVLNIRLGNAPDTKNCPNFETNEIQIRTLSKTPLTFFGDGEILLQESKSIKVRCIHPGIPVVVARAT